MTVSSNINESTFTGNGSSSGPFTFNFDCGVGGNRLDPSEVLVYLKNTTTGDLELKTYGGDYTVSFNPATVGGSISFVSIVPANGQLGVIRRQLNYEQLLAFGLSGVLDERSIEKGLDRTVFMLQDLLARSNRSIQFPYGSSTALQNTLPPADLIANKALVFDASGNVTVSTDDYNDQLANVTAQATAAAASASASATYAAASASSALTAVNALNNMGQITGVAPVTPEGATTALALSTLVGYWANVMAFGAIGDGVTDDTAAFKAAVATGKPVKVPKPSNFYLVSDKIIPKPGQIIMSDFPGMYGSGPTATIKNLTAGGGIFWYDGDTSTGTVSMPHIYNLNLVADYPVKFNNEATAVIGDGTGNVPAGMKAHLVNCKLRPRVNGTGIGLSCSKQFEGVFHDNDIQYFATNVLLNGCDINSFKRNRLAYAYDYMIVNLSASTFGSQNDISDNQLLAAGSTSCIMYKSTARHDLFYNNYLEQATGTLGAALVGFIDLSSVNAPSYAGNTSAGRLSVTCYNNRIDGQAYASDFVYRYEPDGQQFGTIIDAGTTGAAFTGSTVGLKLVDSSGSSIDSIPYLYNILNEAQFEFRGGRFGKWDGYKTSSVPSLTYNGQNLMATGRTNLQGNNAYQYLRARGGTIVLKNGFTSVFSMPYNDTDGILVTGDTYIAEVVAKGASGSQTLKFARIVNGSGDSLVPFLLGTQYQKNELEFKAGSASTDDVGIYLGWRTAADGTTLNTDDIHVDSITIRKKYAKELQKTAASSTVFNVDTTSGRMHVHADDGSTNTADYIFEFVNGKLVQVAFYVVSSGVINITMSQASKAITFTVTGSAGTKYIAVGHIV